MNPPNNYQESSDSYVSDSTSPEIQSNESVNSQDYQTNEQTLSQEDIETIFKESFYADKLRDIDEVAENVNRERQIKLSLIQRELELLSYDEVYKHRKSLKLIFKMMKVKRKEFFKWMFGKKSKLKKRLQKLKDEHPLIIKYLNWIFKGSQEYSEHLNISNDVERAYEQCYFDCGNKEHVKGIFPLLSNK